VSTPVTFSDALLTFLDRPLHAVLATYGPDGAISQSVVWFARDGETVWVSASPRSAKVRHLSDDPRCSLLVLAPHGGANVRIEGRASVDERVSPEQRLDLIRPYVGADAPGWIAQHPLPEPNTLIRLWPERVVSRGL
jgi:PPOX class probable F420-dependent enzyme